MYVYIYIYNLYIYIWMVRRLAFPATPPPGLVGGAGVCGDGWVGAVGAAAGGAAKVRIVRKPHASHKS